MRAHNRHGNHRHAAFDGQIERAFLERQQFAVEGALPFDVDGHVESLVDDRLGGANGLDAGIAIAAIDGNERSHAHGAPEDRHLEQFFLHHHRCALRDERNLDRRIEVRNVIRHEDVAAGVVEAIESDGFDAHAGDPDAGPGAPHKEAIEHADVAHDEGRGKTDQRGNGAASAQKSSMAMVRIISLPARELRSALAFEPGRAAARAARRHLVKVLHFVGDFLAGSQLSTSARARGRAAANFDREGSPGFRRREFLARFLSGGLALQFGNGVADSAVRHVRLRRRA